MQQRDGWTLTRWLFIGAVVMLLAVGCGRTALHTDCDVDADCGADEECRGGVCVAEDDDNGGGGDDGCEDDLDCGDQTCWADPDDEGCLGDVCNQETGQCEVASCIPECDEDERQVGCRCLAATCDSNDDCDGGICHNGSCRPCVNDGECSDDGSEVCEGGLCVESAECSDDDDCRPHEECVDDQCVLRPECTFDDDCGEDERCIGGTCTYTPECKDDDDCSDQAECVGGECQAAVCRGNDECPDDELCDGGECVPPPVALSCEIVTSAQTIAPGQQVTLQAFAYDQDGNGVAASFNWSSSDEDVASIDGNELVGGSTAGTTTVTATLAGGDPVSCDGSPTFENLGPSQDDELRVGVVHMETGDPVEGADVHIGDESAVTDDGGFAYLSDPGESYDVGVFHDDFNYLTVQGVDEDDIRLPITPQTGTGPVAGFTGEFDDAAYQTSGDIELGMAGASLAGDLLDINLARLFGDPFYTEFDVPIADDMDAFPIPGGVTAHGEVFNFEIEGKQTYYVQSAGGPRLAWGIGGQVEFDELLGLFTDPPEDMGSAIGAILPLFSRFDHAQQPKVLEAMPRVLDVNDINNNGVTDEWLPDYQNFPEEDLMPSVRQDLTTHIDISSLPTFDDEQGEVAVLLGGTRAGQMGLVPLGISAVADEDGDGQPEGQTLYMAPPYGSAVGGRYAVMAISFAPGGGGGGGLDGDFSMALWNGQTLPTEISMGTFPDSSDGSIDDADREVVVDEANAGPVFRIRMVDEERSWDIWTKSDDGVAGQFSGVIDIPEAPAGRSDLFDGGEQLLVDGVNTSVTIDDLVRADGVGLHRAGLVTTSFNRTAFR